MSSIFIKKYSAKAIIHSPIEAVWKVLDDYGNYHLWNTFTSAVETNRNIGSRVRLTVYLRNKKKPRIQTEYMENYVPCEAMDWGMNWWPVLKAHRIQRLREITPDTTEYITEDCIRGILCPIVHWIFGKYIQEGLERMAVELKTYTLHHEHNS